MTNRTDELKAAGAASRTREVSSGSTDPVPFIKWGDEYGWIEGQLTALWESQKGYGESATIVLTKCSEGLTGKLGTDIEPIQSGDTINLGLGSATLKGTITSEDVAQNKYFHVAFLRWQRPQNGNPYRIFAVLEIASPEAEEQGIEELRGGEVISDDGLPF